MNKTQSEPKDTNYQYDFTVFTCTYNRSATLARTFKSLKDQTTRNFEWVVFDNGSTDDTPELIRKLIAEADFPVTSIRNEENTGFQNTFNEGVKVAKGRFWMLLDSDDACVPNALEKFSEIWDSIPLEEQASFAGVTVNCNDQHGKLVGSEFPTSPLDSSYVEMMYRYKVKGEKWGIARTDVLKANPFPSLPDHIFPGIVWRAVGKKYKTRYVNTTLRIYYIDEEGRQDQLSFHAKAMGFTATSKRVNSLATINNDLQWFPYAPHIIIRKALVYSWYSFYQNIGFVNMFNSINSWPGKLLVAAVSPFGYLLNLHSKHISSSK